LIPHGYCPVPVRTHTLASSPLLYFGIPHPHTPPHTHALPHTYTYIVLFGPLCYPFTIYPCHVCPHHMPLVASPGSTRTHTAFTYLHTTVTTIALYRLVRALLVLHALPLRTRVAPHYLVHHYLTPLRTLHAPVLHIPPPYTATATPLPTQQPITRTYSPCSPLPTPQRLRAHHHTCHTPLRRRYFTVGLHTAHIHTFTLPGWTAGWTCGHTFTYPSYRSFWPATLLPTRGWRWLGSVWNYAGWRVWFLHVLGLDVPPPPPPPTPRLPPHCSYVPYTPYHMPVTFPLVTNTRLPPGTYHCLCALPALQHPTPFPCLPTITAHAHCLFVFPAYIPSLPPAYPPHHTPALIWTLPFGFWLQFVIQYIAGHTPLTLHWFPYADIIPLPHIAPTYLAHTPRTPPPHLYLPVDLPCQRSHLHFVAPTPHTLRLNGRFSHSVTLVTFRTFPVVPPPFTT